MAAVVVLSQVRLAKVEQPRPSSGRLPGGLQRAWGGVVGYERGLIEVCQSVLEEQDVVVVGCFCCTVYLRWRDTPGTNRLKPRHGSVATCGRLP